MTTTLPVDRNEAFAAERREQLEAATQAQANFDQRLADGKLRNLGNGRFQVTDPGSWDDGEILLRNNLGQIMPQHGLDETTGSVALYTTTPAWHGLGNVVPGGTADIDTVLKLGGIDWEVRKRPVLFQEELGGPTRVLPGKFVTTRGDTHAGLGVVGEKYTVFQNRTQFEFLQDLAASRKLIWESAGAVRDGRRVFVSMRLPESLVIDEGGVADEIIPFVAAMNSHDGSSKFEIVLTPWRPVCGNTERFALRDAVARWGCRHTTNAQERFEQARETLGLSVAYYEEFVAEETALAQTDLAIDEFHKVIDDLFGTVDEDASEKKRKKHEARKNVLTDLFTTNAERLGNTAYAGERAITEFLDHKVSIRPTGSLKGKFAAARATAVMEGDRDEAKNKAHKRLMLLVRR
ncbi:DUF932 domain-containing protein [Micromonospora sp. NPDC047730]|uniref:DUF932 domain-containing protein n=1 Tax=Micromonospora sp. NPDC047730 TaxID=3364253 RepID=UPI003712016A